MPGGAPVSAPPSSLPRRPLSPPHPPPGLGLASGTAACGPTGPQCTAPLPAPPAPLPLYSRRGARRQDGGAAAILATGTSALLFHPSSPSPFPEESREIAKGKGAGPPCHVGPEPERPEKPVRSPPPSPEHRDVAREAPTAVEPLYPLPPPPPPRAFSLWFSVSMVSRLVLWGDRSGRPFPISMVLLGGHSGPSSLCLYGRVGTALSPLAFNSVVWPLGAALRHHREVPL